MPTGGLGARGRHPPMTCLATGHGQPREALARQPGGPGQGGKCRGSAPGSWRPARPTSRACVAARQGGLWTPMPIRIAAAFQGSTLQGAHSAPRILYNAPWRQGYKIAWLTTTTVSRIHWGFSELSATHWFPSMPRVTLIGHTATTLPSEGSATISLGSMPRATLIGHTATNLPSEGSATISLGLKVTRRNIVVPWSLCHETFAPLQIPVKPPGHVNLHGRVAHPHTRILT